MQLKHVGKFISRKSLIYKTDVEYGDYTINHVFGCWHGCKYPCYAYMNAKRFGKVKSYEEWLQPCLVENAMELLDIEIPKLKNKIKMLHLCFTTDPFMYGYEDIATASIDIIKKCNASNIKCSVLTKGILPAQLAQLSKDNEYGITLVSLDEQFRSEYEPNTAPLLDRVSALRRLHDEGCKTWVSIEPYPTPNIVAQELEDILEAISFVDKIIFGRMNYNPQVTKYVDRKEYYNTLANEVITYCNENNIAYHIKDGTIT